MVEWPPVAPPLPAAQALSSSAMMPLANTSGCTVNIYNTPVSAGINNENVHLSQKDLSDFSNF